MSKVFIFHFLHSNLNKHLRQCFSLLFLCSKASESFNRPATHPLKKRKQSLTNKNAWRLKRFALGYPFILDCFQSAFFLRSVEVCGASYPSVLEENKRLLAVYLFLEKVDYGFLFYQNSSFFKTKS